MHARRIRLSILNSPFNLGEEYGRRAYKFVIWYSKGARMIFHKLKSASMSIYKYIYVECTKEAVFTMHSLTIQLFVNYFVFYIYFLKKSTTSFQGNLHYQRPTYNVETI